MSRVCCNSLCSFHCHAVENETTLTSPYPELLCSAGTPSDAQLPVIRRAIERVEKEISATDNHLARLRGAMDQLIRRRAEQADFVKSHRAILSAIRCFPSKILSEIFEKSVNASATFDPRRNEPWMIAQVCSRWRTVALTSPRLWRHFFLPYRQNIHDDAYLMRALSLQLERASHAPLSIRFSRGQLTFDVLDLFLTASAHWEAVTLFLSTVEFDHLFHQSGRFPFLKALTLRSRKSILSADDRVDMLAALPVLEHLELDLSNEEFPRHLLFPWSQLRTCTLTNFHSREVLWILSQLTPNTAVSLVQCANFDDVPSKSQTTSTIRSLTITRCASKFTKELFTSLVAPGLEEFAVESEKNGDNIPRRIMISFLDESACPLTHLRINANTSDGDLIQILESPHARNLVHLDLSATERYNWGANVLTSQHLIPHLRTLVLRGNHKFKHAQLLETLASRRPVLRSVRLDGSQRDMNLQSTVDPDGLEVILFEDQLSFLNRVS
ncbi:hypothetical protein DFH09DRAFT_659087 [Mycena vulgaris]|nr:hypothetical protein DFH09DRAFT_659087 [Mycena vulgaris]